MQFQEGQATALLQEGRVVGAYLKGRGSFDYESTDVNEFPAIRITLEKNGLPEPKPSRNGLGLQVAVSEACIWFDGLLTPGLPGPAASEAAAEEAIDFQAFQSAFRKSGGFALGTALREHQLNDAGRPWIVMEFRGAGGLWTFLHDPGLAREENLACYFKNLAEVKGEGKSLLSKLTVFSKPLGRERTSALPADLTLSRVALDLRAENARHLTARATETFRIHRAGMKALRLNLMERDLEPAGAAGQLVPHPYNLVSVKGSQGHKVTASREGDVLLVEFDKPLEPGSSCELQFEMEGEIIIQPSGDNYWILGEGYFPMPPHHERAFTVEAQLRTRTPFLPLLPGTQKGSGKEGEEAWCKAAIERPVQMYWALAGKYNTIQDTRNGQTVRVATYALSGPNAKVILDIGFDVIKFYEGFLGPFPFKDYLIAQVPELGFGIAPPAVQLITSEAFQPFAGTLNQIYTQGINHRIAHEVAHQYWPHIVHIPDIEQAWLSEAFAEYSSALFIRASRGEGKFDQMAAAWRSNAELSAPLAPLGMANRLNHWSKDPQNGHWARNHLVYDKGALILHAIRKELGDIPFLKYLRALQLNFNGKQISVEHLQGVLDAMTRRDHTAFFQGYVEGTALPPK